VAARLGGDKRQRPLAGGWDRPREVAVSWEPEGSVSRLVGSDLRAWLRLWTYDGHSEVSTSLINALIGQVEFAQKALVR
jgi:hypothetical protein